MGRLTKEEREMLTALSERAQAEEEQDSSTEVWVKNDKGHEVKLTGAKARKFMAQFGVDDDDEGEGEEEEEETTSDRKPAGGGYFAKRKA